MGMDNFETDLSADQYQALAEFRYQIRRFLRLSEEAAAEAGVEPRQYQFLLALKGLIQQKRVTIRDLAERMQLRHHSVVGLINRLVEGKLIERRRGDHDRRQVYIHLTSRGDELLRRLALYHQGELQASGPALVSALQALMANGISVPDEKSVSAASHAD
jgi:DNA-binding MarR family transcriptional regulator